MKKLLILLFIGMLFYGCAQKKDDIITDKERVISEDVKFIDVIAAMEAYEADSVLEYSGAPWSVAVRNLKTDYIYYFDSNNNFIGRKKALIDSNSEGGG